MAPGAAEEGAKVASGFIEALKGQPAVLALMVANFSLLVFMFYALHGAGKFREQMMNQVFENSNRIHEMIQQRAVVCPPSTRSELEHKPVDLHLEQPHKQVE
jgi:hypothetical protein